MKGETNLRRVAMIERELLQAHQQDVQREVTQLALIREARAAQEPPLEQAIVGERRKRRSGLLSPGAVLRATRAFVAQPS
jgi:hypothetical protein